MIYHDVSWFIMIYHDISRYIMIYRCFGWSQWQMSLSRQFLSNKYDMFYWTKMGWHWLQHRVIMINHDISWYITKYQIISDNIRQYQTISDNIMIYHDLSRFIMIYHDISRIIKWILNIENWHWTPKMT